jgi:hypothetical protein
MISAELRFWSKVEKCGPIPAHRPSLGRCWQWRAYITDIGYGLFSFNGTLQGAHRVSFLINIGAIPKGQIVMHKCDNRACVRPSHLKCGTQSENIKDCVSRGRHISQINRDAIPRGERSGGHKLTSSQVLDILSRPLRFGLASSIAKEFNISHPAASDIIKRKSWTHLAV